MSKVLAENITPDGTRQEHHLRKNRETVGTVIQTGLLNKKPIDTCLAGHSGVVVIVDTTNSGKRYPLDVKSGTKVEYLRQQIKSSLEINVDYMDLTFRGKVLEGEHSLSDYGIGQGDQINLCKVLPGDCFHIEVYDENTGKTTYMYTRGCDKIRKLKWVISWKTRRYVRARDQILEYNGQVLTSNGRTVYDYGITEGACLQLTYSVEAL